MADTHGARIQHSTLPLKLPHSALAVKWHIADALKPWKEDKAKPPFTTLQLVAVASIITERSLSPEEFARWILHSFGYYRDLAFDVASKPRVSKCPKAKRLKRLRQDLRATLRHYDLPISVTLPNRYRILPTTALGLLPYALSSRKPGVLAKFPFLRLPAELRNAVYEAVLQYPKSGMYLAYTDGVTAVLCPRADVNHNSACAL